MKKKNILSIAITAILVVFVAVAFTACGDNKDTEPTTTEAIATTTEAPITTEKATTTTTESTTEEITEATTEETTAKPVTTTKKASASSDNKPATTKKQTPETTKKPTTTKTESTTKKPTTTQSNKNEDLSKLGTDFYGDKARAGKYYDDNGNITTYNKIAEGEWYYYYDSDGFCTHKQKPYSKGNEPTTMDLSKCYMCGKSCVEVNKEDACAHGGCTWWIKDVTCYYCGEKVPAHTCHTCKK